MNRKLWKTMLYIIITIILSVLLYFYIVDSIQDHRLVKLATEAAETAIESKDFSLYYGLAEKSYVSTKEKLYIVLAISIAALLIIWYIIITSTNLKIEKDKSETKNTNIFSLKKTYIFISIIGLIGSIVYLLNAIKNHESIAISLILPLDMLCLLFIMYNIRYKYINTYGEDIGYFSSKIITVGLSVLLIIIDFLLYKLIAITGIDIMMWHY